MPSKEEIFESAVDDLDKKVKKRKEKRVVVEEESADEAEEEPEPVVVKAKPKKVKKPITEEHRQRLKDNLARGRATALANRQKNARRKKVEQDKYEEEVDNQLYEDLKRKKDRARDVDEYKKEIEQLKAKLNKPVLVEESEEEEEIEYVKPKRKPKPKPKKKKKTIIVEESSSSESESEEEEVVIVKKKKRKEKRVKEKLVEDVLDPPTPAPPAHSNAPAPRKFKNKDLINLMKSLRN